jgi:hypothetical protein
MLSAKGLGDEPNVSARPRLIRAAANKERELSELIVDGLVTITPELAHRIIQTGKFDRQRPVRVKHVEALAQQMRHREWTMGTQIHFGRAPDGELHLVNGQHRMHAVIKADAAIQFQILVTAVANADGLATLYRRHDRLAARRTTVDALTAEGIPDKYEIRHEIAKATFNAVLLIATGFRAVHHHADPYLMRSDEARLRLCEPWWPIAAHYQDCINNAPANKPPIKRYLQASGAMAVALLTLRDQETKADPFWRGVGDNNGLQSNDPRAAYLRFMVSEKLRTPHETAKAASLAWNAFFHDEPLTQLKVYKTEVVIAGVKPSKKG